MRENLRIYTYLFLGTLLYSQFSWGQAIPLTHFSKHPKLVIVLVVDQLRADYLTRFQSRFLPAKAGTAVGGYQYLMNSGAYYPFAQYSVLRNMTGPGHSIILSGTLPYLSGISSNNWYDSTTNKEVYCVEDEGSPIVGAKTQMGISPKNFSGSTVGDELKNAGHPSRVVSIALKDRAAVLMGGHRADLALWFEPSSFRWVSSQFYLPEKTLPSWINELNKQVTARVGNSTQWKSKGTPTGLTLGTRGFEHVSMIGSKESTALPFGLELTTNAAMAAIDEYKLGRGKATDLLAISFSSHDYAGHTYGPNTLEMEEMTLSGDKELSRLLNYVRTKLPHGLDDVVIALTADHGIPPSSSWLRLNRIDAGSISMESLREALNTQLTKQFGKLNSENWVLSVIDFDVFLNQKAIKEQNVNPEAIENAAKQILLKVNGIATAFTRTEFLNRRLPSGLIEKQASTTFFPSRSGDVLAVPKPFYMDGGGGLSHVTGYSYDRTVPLILSGKRLRPGVYPESADVRDIAPTLSFLLGIIPPALSEGRVLNEAIGIASGR
jgi:predicted AlkP superfamily pyrophosphatase or phosphodiesterase